MNSHRLRLAASICAGALVALPAAAAQRSFVASNGVDNPACSLIAPCRSFAAAIAATNADGEVIVLDSAGYGAFTITKSVSVVAPEGVYAGISVFPGAPNASHGIVVNGAAINVTLRGLTINGQGGDDGIRIDNAGDVFVEKTVIAGTGNDANDAGIRVAATATGTRVFVTDTTLRRSVGHGIHIQANATVVMDRCRVEGGASVGILGNGPGGRLTVRDALVARSVYQGIRLAAGAAGTWEVTVAGSVVEGNALDGIHVGAGTGGSYRVSVTDNVLRSNFNGVNLVAGVGEMVIGVVGNNRVAGNVLFGIGCESNVTLIAERNEVVGNNQGYAPVSCVLVSMGNNTVESNITNVTAPIASGTLR